MTPIAKIRIAAPVAGVFILQVILPVVFMVYLFQIKAGQRQFIDNNYNSADVFQQIELSQEEKANDLLDNNELLYGGIMYDVRSIAKKGDNYILTAIPDKKEADFYRSGIVKNGLDMSLEKKHVYPVPFFLLYFQQYDKFDFKFISRIPGTFPEQQTNYMSNLLHKVPKPPPQFIA